MSGERNDIPRHESVDHEQPTAAGLMDGGDDEVPGTGILGDETLVRSVGDRTPGIAPGPGTRTDASPEPGPTPREALERAEK
ncbi:MAG TPA: hypothetical protein VGR16_06440 [Thermomicrobiales bacterium]|nr:hypothetical protein [Thermomicrobiales bacterium]